MRVVAIICLFVSLVVASELSAEIQAADQTDADRPNIVLIFSDDTGYNEFGFTAALTGSLTNFLTPNIDALAAQSVVMSNGYVSAHNCSPSRAALLTGQYQQRFGFEALVNSDPVDPNNVTGIPARLALISEHLKNVPGVTYTTGVVGKWHVGSVDNMNRPLDKGFDEYFGMLNNRSYWKISTKNVKSAMRRSIDGDEAKIEAVWANEGDNNLYDPVQGRYLTDAISEEATAFIRHHAGDADPFFLYVPYNATHGPQEAKQQDLARVSKLPSAEQKIAAMALALDRGVGMITAALNDPDGDGDSADSIADNTIVVFVNDNGGPQGGSKDDAHDNAPFNGFKTTAWEGGIRVPFTIKAPGLSPGTYDKPVTTRDLLPTFVSAAGGDISELDVDGVDLMPFLTGDQTGDPHEVLFWRQRNVWAVRRGDWKLVRATKEDTMALFDLATDVGETTDVLSQQPEVVAALLRDLTVWESTLNKPRWGAFGANNRNLFDRFVFRADQAHSSNWGVKNIWREGGTSNNVRLNSEDSYCNAILEFPTREDADYTAVNNMTRVTEQTFMLNEIRLTGRFAGAADRSGMINGNSVLFTKNLSDASPKIHNQTVVASGGGTFTYFIDMDLLLLGDLEFSGNGASPLVISGDISDYDTPKSLNKTGRSTVTFTGTVSHVGTTSLSDGTLLLATDAAISQSPEVNTAAGTILGGNGRIEGALTAAGTVTPGLSVGTLSVGSAELAGSLAIEVDGNDADRLAVDGNLAIGRANLEIKLLGGGATRLAYVIASFGTREGAFATVTGIPAGYYLDYDYGPSNSQIALVRGDSPKDVDVDHVPPVFHVRESPGNSGK